MLRKQINDLRKLARNDRGANLISYALLVGGLAVLLSGVLGKLSGDLTQILTNQATSLKESVGTPGSPTASIPNGSSPSTPVAPGGGKGNGNKGKGNKGRGNKGRGNKGRGS